MEHALKDKVVLVVDDEEDLREILAEEFMDLGSKVIQASSGTEAYAKTEATNVDVIVSDVRMPGGDGVELLKKIQARNPQEPVVILVTGFSDFDTQNLVTMGAYAVLSKPFDPSEVIAVAVKAIMSKG